MIDMRRLSDDLTEAFIRYQHRLDNPFPSSTETEAVAREKYMNDPVFYTKVRSLVVGVMDIVWRNVAAKEEGK